MVVCKFFLQGTCKFGSYCHFEHQIPSNYTSFSDNGPATSILRQSNFGATQPQAQNPKPHTGNVDINTLVKAVSNDMIGAEKGGQWLLSSYSPFKEKPAFPGFEDHSPDEIRYGFYEAQKSNTLDQYKQQLQALLQSNIIKIKALQNPTTDIINILQGIYKTPPASCSGTYGQNTLTTSNNTNVFGTQNNNSVFGQTSTGQQGSSNIFSSGTSQNMFSGSNPVQPFGSVAPSANQSQNIFASNTPQNSLFGGQTGNMFPSAAPTAPASSGNIFASAAQTPLASSGNMFANAAQPASSGNVFANAAQPAPPTSGNIFATQNPSQAPFGNASPFNNPSEPTQNPTNIFLGAGGTQPPSFSQQTSPQNIFVTQNPAPSNIFATSNQPNTIGQSSSQNYSASIFGNPVTTSTPSMGYRTPQIDESLYSKLEDLIDEERKWFENDTLDLTSIPDKPPTYDMCFKS